MKRPALQNKKFELLQMTFLARKVFGTHEKQVPGSSGWVKQTLDLLMFIKALPAKSVPCPKAHVIVIISSCQTGK